MTRSDCDFALSRSEAVSHSTRSNSNGTHDHQRIRLHIRCSGHPMTLRLWRILPVVSLAFCGGETPVAPAPPTPTATAMTVSPSEVLLQSVGDTVRMVAEVSDQNGNVMHGVSVVWGSHAVRVATVDASGLVTAVDNGSADITAGAASVTAVSNVTVAQEVDTIVISPTADTLLRGHTLNLTADVVDANGHTVTAATVAWTSSDVNIATVDDSGLVSAVEVGQVVITAAVGGQSGSAEIVVAAPPPNPDRAALVSLYEATDGPNWKNRDNWLSDRPLGEWYGVTTDASGQITRSLSLDDNKLSGEIPPELGNLANLESLILGANLLNGEIPVELGQLSKLRTLDLTGNRLGGRIPPELGRLSELEELQLSRNQLVDHIPPELGRLPKLRTLDLANNRLGGRIPPELGQLSELEELQLSRNELVDDIPPDLGHLSKLRLLMLDHNGLGGGIPPELGQLTGLGRLILNFNPDLGGELPVELGQLTNLEYLNLENTGLSGEIPPEFGQLTRLAHLALNFNDLGGEIPAELGRLPQLRRIGISYNRLRGEIPAELGRLISLGSLDLKQNRLSGAIPPEIGDLKILTYLGLSGNRLSAAIPPELGQLTNLKRLHLNRNELSGPIPGSLGFLARLLQLSVHENQLTGPLPQSLLRLKLDTFQFGEGNQLCLPGVRSFVNWLDGIEHRDEAAFCNESDRSVLESIFVTTNGGGWLRSVGWLESPAVAEWHGVEADSLGHVVSLDLSSNGLNGILPSAVGDLDKVTLLRVDGNLLSGRLPESLTRLGLVEFTFSGTTLCVPDDNVFRAWLNGIDSHEGTGITCDPLSDRDALERFYEATGGPNWRNNTNWMSDRPLGEWYGVSVDTTSGRVTELRLRFNQLSGSIPPELADLSSLDVLQLDGNQLFGSIPPQLGRLPVLSVLFLSGNRLTGGVPPDLSQLDSLRALRLSYNQLSGQVPQELSQLSKLAGLSLIGNRLTGSIPSELGRLNSLIGLQLANNQLSGPVPPELSQLSGLKYLHLSRNKLVGGIPPELGRLAALEQLRVDDNSLSGTLPGELGGLAELLELQLSNNVELTGPLPLDLINLSQLKQFEMTGTDLCAPSDTDLAAWLSRFTRARIRHCRPPASNYLVQAVQSRTFPVALLEGEPALLRVFVTAPVETEELLPPVRATFFLDGVQVYEVETPPGPRPIPLEVHEGDLELSANTIIPGSVLREGLEMVIEIDPRGMTDPVLGIQRRIPEVGRETLDVRAVPRLDLTLIPFRGSRSNDSLINAKVRAMAADPRNHELLAATRTLLPIAAMAVTAHEPVLISELDQLSMIRQIEAIRIMEGGGGHYMGIFGGVGAAILGGWSSISRPSSSTIAHELGHNLGLRHAPCGDPAITDRAYPNKDGSTGAWGWDMEAGELVPPYWVDLMAYCRPEWISEYHYSIALRYRLANPGSASRGAAGPLNGPTLLIWGGTDTDGAPFLEPAFFTTASPQLPPPGTAYHLTARTGDGEIAFSYTFDMPEIADGEGESAFAFAIPHQGNWSSALASITLSGPGGTATLDEATDQPLFIMRSPRSGQVRAFLRDPPALSDELGLETIFSRGLPTHPPSER